MGEVVDLGFDEVVKKRIEAESFRRLIQTEEWGIFVSYLEQMCAKYVQQLLNPVQREFEAHYLRGVVKGLDVAKTLPNQIIRIYDGEVAEGEQPPTGSGQPVEPGLRLSPIAPGDDSA